jgi:hypothetical protein
MVAHFNPQMQLLLWLATAFCLATYALWYRIKFVLRTHGHAPHWLGFGIQHMQQVHHVIKHSEDAAIKTRLRRLLTAFYRILATLLSIRRYIYVASSPEPCEMTRPI